MRSLLAKIDDMKVFFQEITKFRYKLNSAERTTLAFFEIAWMFILLFSHTVMIVKKIFLACRKINHLFKVWKFSYCFKFQEVLKNFGLGKIELFDLFPLLAWAEDIFHRSSARQKTLARRTATDLPHVDSATWTE